MSPPVSRILRAEMKETLPCSLPILEHRIGLLVVVVGLLPSGCRFSPHLALQCAQPRSELLQRSQLCRHPAAAGLPRNVARRSGKLLSSDKTLPPSDQELGSGQLLCTKFLECTDKGSRLHHPVEGKRLLHSRGTAIAYNPQRTQQDSYDSCPITAKSMADLIARDEQVPREGENHTKPKLNTKRPSASSASRTLRHPRTFENTDRTLAEASITTLDTRVTD